jgi:magnesium chelatase subunit I
VAELWRRAVKLVFDEHVPLEGMAGVVESFRQGWKVEVSADIPAEEYLEGLDEIPGLRDGAARLSGGEEPARVASAIEFLLEGLHLSNRLNKTVREGRTLFARA